MITLIKKPLILIGGGGHCKSCIEVIEAEGDYQIHGILDLPEKVGQEILGYPIIGTDTDIEKWIGEEFWFLITIGQIHSAEKRKFLFEQLCRLNAQIATIISPQAWVSSRANIGTGSIVMHAAIVNTEAQILENTTINTGALIEHEASVGKHCHISTYAVVNGQAKIGDEVFIGSNACVHQTVEITTQTIIGAQSNVSKNIYTAGTYAGNPLVNIK